MEDDNSSSRSKSNSFINSKLSPSFVNGDKKVKFKKNPVGDKKENRKWTVFITSLSFVSSGFFVFISEELLERANSITAFIILLAIILIGIIFDIVGVAVTSAEEAPFHAMASKKYYGAKHSIKLIRNANRVSNFCNDVVGDICGIISGTASTLILVRIARGKSELAESLLGLVISGMVAALTVGGKAMGKTIAISNSNYIIYKLGVILQLFTDRKRGNKTVKNNK